MEKERLFFQVYQGLENELLEMTDYIHFSDANLDVYSVKLANFILRANVECESLLKELFKKTEHYDKLSVDDRNSELEHSTYKQVNKSYNLQAKEVFISSEIFFFQSKYSESFSPFKYKKNKNDLHKIYNAIKHDKVNNLNKADLETAINVLAVLFILNICFYPGLIYKNENDRSKIFRGKKALIEPIFWSNFNEITELNREEVDTYISHCLYFEWIDESYLKIEEHVVREKQAIQGMLNHHLDEVNLTLDQFLQKRSDEYGRKYFNFDFYSPSSLNSYTILVNTGFTLKRMNDRLNEIFDFESVVPSSKVKNHLLK